MINFLRTSLIAFLAAMVVNHALAQSQAGEISLSKIFDDGQYNAFTDLGKFRGHYYCTFRNAISHGGASHNVMGSIVVIRSADRKHWTEVARFSQPGVDLRDPKMLVTEKEIRIYAVDCRLRKNGAIQYANCAWTSDDGVGWSDSTLMAPGYIFWRPKTYKGKYYVPAYARRPGYCGVDILVSDDGYDWHMLSTPLPPARVEGETLWANETEILFLKNGKALLFARRNYTGTPNPKLAELGGFRTGVVLESSADDLTHWKPIDDSLTFHCPAAIEHNRRIILAGRDKLPLGDGRVTETGRVWEFAPGQGFTRLLHLKTHGDSSYPGLVAEGDELTVSYYSTHDGETAYFEKPGKADVFLTHFQLDESK